MLGFSDTSVQYWIWPTSSTLVASRCVGSPQTTPYRKSMYHYSCLPDGWNGATWIRFLEFISCPESVLKTRCPLWLVSSFLVPVNILDEWQHIEILRHGTHAYYLSICLLFYLYSRICWCLRSASSTLVIGLRRKKWIAYRARFRAQP